MGLIAAAGCARKPGAPAPPAPAARPLSAWPQGHTAPLTITDSLVLAIPLLAAKLAAAGVGLALIETLSAKLRVFRAPEYLATAFLLAVLGLLVHLLLGD